MFDAPTRYYASDALSLDELAYGVAFSRIIGIGPVRFTIRDKDYPPLLKEISHAPPVLYVAGTLKKEEDRFALGVVGTRKASSYGRQVTEQFARELAQGDVTVVSGLAHGIDTIAHTCALERHPRGTLLSLTTIIPPEYVRYCEPTHPMGGE